MVKTEPKHIDSKGLQKIIDALSESKDENADDLTAKGIEETDETIQKIQCVLITTDKALSKIK